MVILTNKNDEALGYLPKLEAHQTKALHLAFSVFIFYFRNELLQQQALYKYHTPGKWTNTCCSHPQMGETKLEGTRQRLNEEIRLNTILNISLIFNILSI